MIGDLDYCINVVNKLKVELENSDWYDRTIKSLESFTKNISSIRCLAIGKVSDGLSPRFQLAFLLLVMDKYGAKATAWDPIFEEMDLQVLQHFNIPVVEQVDGIPSLWYIPHGPLPLMKAVAINGNSSVYLGNDLDRLDNPFFAEYIESSRIVPIDPKSKDRWFAAFYSLALHGSK